MIDWFTDFDWLIYWFIDLFIYILCLNLFKTFYLNFIIVINITIIGEGRVREFIIYRCTWTKCFVYQLKKMFFFKYFGFFTLIFSCCKCLFSEEVVCSGHSHLQKMYLDEVFCIPVDKMFEYLFTDSVFFRQFVTSRKTYGKQIYTFIVPSCRIL